MKRAMGMFVALIMALGMTGVVYATWSETLYINGTVNTGNVSIKVTKVECSDDEADGKDYSNITCCVEGEENPILNVVVTDAYPCITYTCTFTITNDGTVPVKLKLGDITKTFPTGGNADDITVTVTLAGDEPYQTHPNESITGTITVHVEESAQESATYGFSMSILAWQWNKDFPGW